MKYRRNLLAGLIGLALLAAPITTLAKDNDSGKYNSHQSQSQSHQNASASHNAPAHSNAPVAHSYSAPARSSAPARNAAPAPVTRSESRDQRAARTLNTAPGVAAPREGRETRNDSDRRYHDRSFGYRDDHDRGDYDSYAVGAPYYVMPRGYAGGACGWARHLRRVYRYDRDSGHPAAAADLLPRLRRAERSCGGVPYGYNGYR